jgi:putative type II/III system pilus formation protein
MTFRPSKKELPCLSLLLAALLVAGTTSPVKAQNAGANQKSTANNIVVLIDQASLVRLDRPVAEIVVGNPSIADVSVQSGKVLIVTGKSFGETNLIVIDADGKTIIDRRLIVQEPRTGFVTLYRGSAQQTLHCAPYCAPELMIGDERDVFEAVAKQITTKQSIGQSAAEGEKQP